VVPRRDIEGERDFAGLQLSAFRTMLERGDAGVRMVPRRLGAGRAVPLALQVVEGDLIATERNGVWETSARGSAWCSAIGTSGSDIGFIPSTPAK
jgi:hypothetical protein